MSIRQWAWIMLALGFALGGCSGGSGDGGGSERAPGSLRWPGQPLGKVSIVATDAFKSPVAGAVVSISRNDGIRVALVTDSAGRAASDFPAGELFLNVTAPDLAGGGLYTLSAGQKLDLSLTLYPEMVAAGGVARAEVTPGGVSADGTTLEFTLQILGVANTLRPVLDLRLRSCTPDAANDAPAFVADCIAGPAGFDAPYAGAESDKAVDVAYRSDSGYVGLSYAATLMIGQDDQTALADPGDQRLLAAAHFFEVAHQAFGQVLLAAFASNDPASGRPSLLPRQPVTLFPTANPRFTTDGRSYFGTLNTLATMEGGASPLLAAIGQMIEFNAGAAVARKPALVVVSGPGNDCGAATACRAQVLQLVERSRVTGVPVVTVGVHAKGSGDPEVLGLLAGGAEGSAAFWVDEPKQLPNTLRALGPWLSGGAPFLEARFRMRSPVPGAFASGRVVKGEVVVTVCPWHCYDVPVPFMLRIP